MPPGLILGIETSCDETAAAVVAGGLTTLSSVVASQISTHAPWGGVVPELASREHLRNIVPVVRAALREASVTLAQLDAIAVTEGPGLAGALLVGVTYAKTLSWVLGKPLLAVNHLEGHIHAVLLEHAAHTSHADPGAGPTGSPQTPALALVVSGGHTHLYLAAFDGDTWHYRPAGRTVDDAAGEAFDKVAKLLGLPYPGGPWIDRLAPHGDPAAIRFRFAEVRPRSTQQRTAASLAQQAPREQAKQAEQEEQSETLFSFSGIKTAVLRHVEAAGLAPSIQRRAQALAQLPDPTLTDMLALCDRPTLDLVASFQRAVVTNLVERTASAAARHGAQSILVSGGVAANGELRAAFARESERTGLPVLFPSRPLSTDNAAMIAAAAWPRLQARRFSGDELSANPRLQLR